MTLENTLVIVCSTSGDTEETLQMVRAIVKKRPDMVTISAGGKLKELRRQGRDSPREDRAHEGPTLHPPATASSLRSRS